MYVWAGCACACECMCVHVHVCSAILSNLHCPHVCIQSVCSKSVCHAEADTYICTCNKQSHSSVQWEHESVRYKQVCTCVIKYCMSSFTSAFAYLFTFARCGYLWLWECLCIISLCCLNVLLRSHLELRLSFISIFRRFFPSHCLHLSHCLIFLHSFILCFLVFSYSTIQSDLLTD